MNLPNVTDLEIAAIKALSDSEVAALKEKINTTYPTKIFEGKGKSTDDKCGIICPECGNGSGEDGTPVEAVRAGSGVWLYHCQKCGEFSGDLLKIIADEENLNLHTRDDYFKALAIGASLIGYVTGTPLKQKSAQHVERKNYDDDAKRAKQLPLIKADIADAQAHLEDLPESQRRGISVETYRHFQSGYLEKWVHPQTCIDGKKGFPSRRVIFPAGEHYQAVALPADRDGMEKKYWKLSAGSLKLFNGEALRGDEQTVIVVEGQYDAMSIWQAFGGKIAVVAVLGVRNWQTTLLPLLDDCAGKKFLVLFDVDKSNAGENGANNLRRELQKRNFAAVNYVFDDFMGDEQKQAVGEKIDANAILQTLSEETLKDLTEKILAAAQIELAAQEEKIAADRAFNEKISAWEEDNSQTIHPDIVAKLKEAVALLESLTPMTITAANSQSSKTKRAIALCKFYDTFAPTADEFFLKLSQAKKLAAAAVKKIREEGSEFVAEPQPALIALANLSVHEIKADVEKLKTEYKKFQTNWKDSELRRAIQEKRKQKQQAAAAAAIDSREKLEALKTQPESAERNAEMRRIINRLCDWKKDKDGHPVAVRASQGNADLIFTYDPDLDGLFGYDEFQQADVFLKAPPWNKNIKRGDLWTDRDDAQAQTLIRRAYKDFEGDPIYRKNHIDYSNARRFHEVKDYFKNLPAWDGLPRAETLFIDWLGVEDSAFARAVTWNWLTAAVARIFHPGCAYQTSLVIHGNQGVGKGFIFEQLGGKWYKAISDRVDDSHAVDTIKTCWLGEFKEMAGMRKADADAIKAFIELPADTRRFAYDRRATTVPRHCVFAITVNDEQFLSDLTGNRRFLILHSTLPKFGYVKEVRGEKLSDKNVIAQIWAEVLAHYKELFAGGFDEKKLSLSAKAAFEGEEIATQYLRDDNVGSEVKAFVNQKILPTVIWDLLTKEERRKFFVDKQFVISEKILEVRFENSAKRISPAQREAYYAATASSNKSVLRVEGRDKQTGEATTNLVLLGSVYRERICAAEIFNEAFGNDKRKSMPRISEILARLEGWTLGKRIDRDNAYGCQKKVYWRDADNLPDDEGDDDTESATPANESVATNANNNLPTANLQGEPISSNEVPPFDENDLPL